MFILQSSLLGSASISQLLGDIPISYPAYTVLVLIFILFVYRITRAVAGEKYSYIRIFFTPALYSVFVLMTFLGSPQYQIIIGIIVAVLGLILGSFLSRKLKVFEKHGKMYFKASVIITILWTFSFTGKILALLYYPSLGILVGSSVLLTLTTGMLIAEALVIHYRHFSFQKNSGQTG